jgi:hypothetical protein
MSDKGAVKPGSHESIVRTVQHIESNGGLRNADGSRKSASEVRRIIGESLQRSENKRNR